MTWCEPFRRFWNTGMNSNRTAEIEVFKNGLRGIGAERGDLIICHNSFKALALKRATPRNVIDAFLDYLGDEGTLMMPTFTYSYSGIWGVKPFHPENTPGVANGILTETLRKHPKALRSRQPAYSVAAAGKHAEEITRDKEHASPLGRGSSYEVAIQLSAKILLLGVGNDRNSVLHYAEVVADLPYLDIPFRDFWGRTALVEKNGEVVEVPLKNEFPACSDNFGVADAYLEELGILKRAKIASADSILMDADEMVDALVRQLHRKPDWLLCNDLTCEPCTLSKRRLKEQGLI